jgi:putative hydrolase
MKILADLHNHTVASGHAYSTMEELISRAVKKKIKILGVSDHAPGLPGGANIFHFSDMSRLMLKAIKGIRVPTATTPAVG